jgi:hypothetical protein
MVLIVLGAWVLLAALTAVGFAALGRAGLQEEQEEDRQLEWLEQIATLPPRGRPGASPTGTTAVAAPPV